MQLDMKRYFQAASLSCFLAPGGAVAGSRINDVEHRAGGIAKAGQRGRAVYSINHVMYMPCFAWRHVGVLLRPNSAAAVAHGVILSMSRWLLPRASTPYPLAAMIERRALRKEARAYRGTA